MITADQIIEHFGMRPLPEEGGYYVQTYRCSETLDAESLPERYTGGRRLATAILYLLTPDTFSAMHRVRSDEIWSFHLGDPVQMLQLKPDGRGDTVILGSDVLKGQTVQTVVRAGTWQGARLVEGGSLALMGTVVAPGFEFEDFELALPGRLMESYPENIDLIRALTRE